MELLAETPVKSLASVAPPIQTAKIAIVGAGELPGKGADLLGRGINPTARSSARSAS